MPGLTVILCTHNPRPDFLQATLAALREQTLPVGEWEFLLIDNASTTPLAGSWDLSWHPRARHIREEELGLTPARLRGIAETATDLIVFVDDDNVLDADYLTQTRRIADTWPMLGIWGGAIRPRFEVQPPEWTRPHWGMLAIVECERSRWSNLPDRGDTRPCGAGMVVRKAIAVHYADAVRNDPQRKQLGRRGSSLASAEDSDLVLTAIEAGFGSGVFPELKLTHLIPPGRTTEEYLLRLTENMTCSGIVLNGLRKCDPPPPSLARRFYELCRLLILDARSRRFELARRRGTKTAQTLLSQLR